jgi:hypothetical protein
MGRRRVTSFTRDLSARAMSARVFSARVMSARVLAAGAFASLAEAPARAGFLQPEHVTQVIYSGYASQFSRQFDGRGRLRRAMTFSKLGFETYIERGFSERAMFLGRLQAEQESPAILDESTAIRQLRSAELGARVFLGEVQGIRVSTQLLAGWRNCVCGPSALALEGAVIAARPLSVQGMHGFVDMQAAYRHTGRLEPAEFRLQATAGLRPHKDVLLLAQMSGAAVQPQRGSPSGWRLKAEISAVWDISTRWSLQAGVFTTLAGRNQPQESGVRLAVWRRFGVVTPQPEAFGF